MVVSANVDCSRGRGESAAQLRLSPERGEETHGSATFSWAAMCLPINDAGAANG